jgi:hypothetical protein
MLSLILDTVLIPLVLGLAFGLIGQRLGRAEAVVIGLAILAIYVLLEGMPAFPPTAGKQKLAYILAAAVLVAYLPRPRLVAPLFLVVAALWLGWPKFSRGVPDIGLILVFAPAVAALIAVPQRSEAATQGFLWPAVLMVFGLGAAALSVLGVFMGFAQAMGAEVALLGGALAVAYLRGLYTGQFQVFGPETLRQVLMSLAATSLMIALFAPDINLTAYALLSVTLVVPALPFRFGAMPAALRPFAFAAMAAVPAFLAVLLAYGAAPAMAS